MATKKVTPKSKQAPVKKSPVKQKSTEVKQPVNGWPLTTENDGPYIHPANEEMVQPTVFVEPDFEAPELPVKHVDEVLVDRNTELPDGVVKHVDENLVDRSTKTFVMPDLSKAKMSKEFQDKIEGNKIKCKPIVRFVDGTLQPAFAELKYDVAWPAGEVRTLPRWLIDRCIQSGAELEMVDG